MRNKIFNFIVAYVAVLLIGAVLFSNQTVAQTSIPDPNSQQSGQKTTGSTTELEKELEAAKQSAAKLREIYVGAQRLAKNGSVSQMELRRTNFDYKLAMLKVIELESPAKAKDIALAQAQLELDLLTKELEVIASLYQRGSASELEYQRAQSAFDVAKFSLRAVQDGQGEKLHKIKSAQTKLKLAGEIFQKADRLIKSGSISQTVFEQAETNLQNAEDDLELARKELGVSVRQVPPSDGANR